jgi:hypothetical protein
MRGVAVLSELPMLFGNGSSRQSFLTNVKAHFGGRTGPAVSLYGIPSNVADVPLWRMHKRFRSRVSVSMNRFRKLGFI